MESALTLADVGVEIPFATISHELGVVGSTRFLALWPQHRSVEIGWTWLHPSAWGTGVNVEAKLLQLRHAFEAWGCVRVEMKTDAQNERARAALEALGATLEGIHRKHRIVRGGETRDTAWYSIVDDEWPAVRARLEARLAPRYDRTAVCFPLPGIPIGSWSAGDDRADPRDRSARPRGVGGERAPA